MSSRRFLHAALATIALALTAPACSDDTSPPDPTHEEETTATIDQAELRMAVRALFEDRVAWTRLYLVETTQSLPGQQAAADRLMANGQQLGDAIAPFYGDDAAAALTGMLNETVGHAAAAVDAAMNGDMDGFTTARAAWYAEADDVAAFLASANPAWVEADLAALLHGCIDDAVSEATALMEGDVEASLEAFDSHKEAARTTADVLASGIAGQFADDVGEVDVSPHEEGLRVAMRDLFFDRATFVRLFVIDALESLPGMDDSIAGLMQNDADIGNAIRPFYGDEAADQLTALLDAGLEDAAALVMAAKAGDDAAFEDAKNSWLAHADETATFLAGANPAWSEADLKVMLRTCVEDVIAEAGARLEGDYDAETAAHDVLSKQARSVADALGQGVAAQFPES